MAVIKIRTSTLVRRIWVHVICQECFNPFNIQMKGASTNKNCPFCGDGTFRFLLTPMPGYLQISAEFLGSDWIPQDYPITTDDVEVEEEKD